MGNLLAKWLIHDYKNYSDEKVRVAYGKLSGIVGIISNLVLTIIKIITGLLSGSISIIADGVNNLSDAGSSIITLIGFKASSAPADKNHPFGHQRIEYITGLIVSFIILFIGFSLLKTSIDKIINQEKPQTSWLLVIVLIISILIKIWQSAFYRKNGKLIKSTTLIVTSTDSLNDSIATSVVLISVIIAIFTGINLDGWMGIIVSIIIMISGFKLIKQTISPLIGEAPDRELIEQYSNELLGYKGVLGIHDMVIHTYGPAKTFMTVHVEVDSSSSFVESHDIIDNIEHDFLIKHNINLVIHMDPIETKCEATLELKEMVRDVLHEVDPVLRFHDFRVVNGPTHTNMIFDVVVPIKYEITNDELKSKIKNTIKINNPKLVAVITVDQAFINEDIIDSISDHKNNIN